MMRPARLLILSFSPISSDARVLKQVALFSGTHDVTTCGYGPAPEGVKAHIQIPDELIAWRLNRAALMARRYRYVQATQEVVAWLRTQLEPGSFDVVLANDVETVALALWLRPRGGVHADLHEYAPRQKENVPRWRYFVAPYIRWQCRTFVTRAQSVTTVAGGLAREYQREFGIDAAIVTNATPYREGEPTAVAQPIRLVHSGAALSDRHLDIMIDAMRQVQVPATLDLYLTPNDPAVITDLRRRAAAIPGDAVRVLDPVPYAQLVSTLAGYDVGVFTLPPVSFNYEHALPNKLFDYIQARLGILVSPNPEMAQLVRDHHLGWVTADDSAQALAQAINTLDVRAIETAKAASHAAAPVLCAQQQMQQWVRAIEAATQRALAGEDA